MENKINYLSSKSSVRFEIWTPLFFRAPFDLSNLRGQIEKPQILLWILMWKKGKILVVFEVKVSILIVLNYLIK